MCDDPDASALLRSALADYRISQVAPLGFVLDTPRDGRELATLTDRCGFVLARTRTIEQALAVLGGHLTALFPAARGTVRYRMRALLKDEGSVALAAFPLLAAPPVVERRLERLGWRIVDRLTVDVEPSSGTLALSEVPWPELAALDPGPGHTPLIARADAIRLLFVPEVVHGQALSFATVLHALVSAVVPGADRETSLAAAERLARATRHRSVSLDEPTAIYSWLLESK